MQNVILNKKIDISIKILMSLKKQVLFPKHKDILKQMGEQIKLARKRRKLTTTQVAERAAIVRRHLVSDRKREP